MPAAGRKIAVLCLTVSFAASACARAAPFVPANDDVVVETLPGAGNKPAQELRRLTAALSHAPNLLELALKVAQRNIALGQSETDPRYDGRAEAALAPWINLPDPPMQVRLYRAILRQRVHDFTRSLADLDAVLQTDPDNRQARLIRATVHQVRGDYADALKDCMVLGAPTDRVGAICAASVHSVTGLADQGLQELANADRGAFTADELPTKLWALTLTAETASRLGRDGDAEAAFRAALDLGLRDPYLLGAYADFLLDQGRAAEVENLLQRETRIDPLLLRLALAEQKLARPLLDVHIADLAERFGAARQRGDTAHRREESRFSLELLNRPPIALKLAEDNWAVQHEPADVRLMLETSAAAKSPDAAAPVLAFLSLTRLEYAALKPLVAAMSVQN